MTDHISTIRQAQELADAILGVPGKLGLAEVPGNEIPDEAYNLACMVREVALDALEAERLTPEEAQWILDNCAMLRTARPKLERIAGARNDRQ